MSPVEVCSSAVVAVANGRVVAEDVILVDASDVAGALVLVVRLLDGTGTDPPKFPGLVAMIELVVCVSVLTTMCTVGAPVGRLPT